MRVPYRRDSADQRDERKVTSAARLLCAFGTEPVWTWRKVSLSPLVTEDTLCNWQKVE